MLVVKNLSAQAVDTRDASLIPGSVKCPGEGRGNPLQHGCLENPTDRATWWATVHRVAKCWTQLKCTKCDIVQFRTSIGNLWSNPFILLVEKSSLRGKGHATQLNKAEWQQSIISGNHKITLLWKEISYKADKSTLNLMWHKIYVKEYFFLFVRSWYKVFSFLLFHYRSPSIFLLFCKPSFRYYHSQYDPTKLSAWKYVKHSELLSMIFLICNLK